jgi:hypothetical protein
MVGVADAETLSVCVKDPDADCDGVEEFDPEYDVEPLAEALTFIDLDGVGGGVMVPVIVAEKLDDGVMLDERVGVGGGVTVVDEVMFTDEDRVVVLDSVGDNVCDGVIDLDLIWVADIEREMDKAREMVIETVLVSNSVSVMVESLEIVTVRECFVSMTEFVRLKRPL